MKTSDEFVIGAPLLMSEVSTSFMEFGGTKIKFTSDDLTTLKKSVLGDDYVGLKLICFKPRSEKFEWSQFVRPGHFVYPNETVIQEGSRNIFAALVHKCYERKVIAICSFKPNELSMPSFVALDPQIETTDSRDGLHITPSGFCLIYLPFQDDFRQGLLEL